MLSGAWGDLVEGEWCESLGDVHVCCEQFTKVA
jgi:hypothetical protein